MQGIVGQAPDHELTVHGIRMAGKVLVVEMCHLNQKLQAEQLHVAPLHDIESLPPLSRIDPVIRRDMGSQIWYSVAQSLKHFVKAGAGFCLLSPENIHIDTQSQRIYITGWSGISEQEEESCWLLNGSGKVSLEKMYLAQLAILYHFIESGDDLHAKLKDVNISWRDKQLKSAIGSLKAEEKFKENLLRATQLHGSIYTDINALIDGVRPYFYQPAPHGFLPFLGGLWIGFSATASIAMGALVFRYSPGLLDMALPWAESTAAQLTTQLSALLTIMGATLTTMWALVLQYGIGFLDIFLSWIAVTII